MCMVSHSAASSAHTRTMLAKTAARCQQAQKRAGAGARRQLQPRHTRRWEASKAGAADGEIQDDVEGLIERRQRVGEPLLAIAALHTARCGRHRNCMPNGGAPAPARTQRWPHRRTSSLAHSAPARRRLRGACTCPCCTQRGRLVVVVPQAERQRTGTLVHHSALVVRLTSTPSRRHTIVATGAPRT
jgi:hypothetical protein